MTSSQFSRFSINHPSTSFYNPTPLVYLCKLMELVSWNRTVCLNWAFFPGEWCVCSLFLGERSRSVSQIGHLTSSGHAHSFAHAKFEVPSIPIDPKSHPNSATRYLCYRRFKLGGINPVFCRTTLQGVLQM